MSRPTRNVSSTHLLVNAELGAGKVASTSLSDFSRAGVDQERVERDVKKLSEQGYVICERIISETTLHQVKAACKRALGSIPAGRNSFEGFSTQRIYQFSTEEPQVWPLTEHHHVLAVVDKFLDKGYSMALDDVISINPGEKAQLPHHDDMFLKLGTRPRACHVVATVWALDEFTPENGGTRIWPGSHRWPEGREPRKEDPVILTSMPAGSVVIFLSTLR